ncbi:hemerythrin domain-containing protein [Candidatus Rariloculus sp.]|uniref:hemerythrin domain-containing protein n=1 Tax=Candidatus Rariloculus sp. TaxID=3101265 RepID=UPI003D11D58C
MTYNVLPGTRDLPSLDIDSRTGWPDELRVLLNDYPRDSWRSNPSPVAQFWLDKHDYFRHQCAALKAAGDDYREGRSDAMVFATWLAPRLQNFIAHLHGHHQVEDHHYFPAFRAAEVRLAAGFDVLASDHELLHEGIADIIATINAFIETLRAKNSADATRHAGDRYLASSMTTFRRLLRHLSDEEDLIIPVMLDRG